MRIDERRTLSRLIPMVLLGALAASTFAEAAPPPAPQAPAPGGAPQAAPFGMVAVRSFDAVTAVAKELGFPLPPDASAQQIERQFPFIGAGGFATDQPAGIVFVGGDVQQPQDMVVFAFPVKAGAATLEKLTQMGGKPMPGRPDAVLLNTVGMRRTAGHLLFAPRAEAVTAVAVDALTAAFKRPDALALVTVDLKSIRTNAPAIYGKFLADLAKADRDLPPGDPAREAGRDAGRALRTELARLERISLTVDHGANLGLRLAATLQPLKLPAARADAVRPGLPPNCFFRLDLGFSPGEALKGPIDAMMQAGLNSAEKEGKALTAAQRKQLEGILTRMANLLGGAQSATVGVELAADGPVVYLVNQYTKPVDYSAELRQVTADVNAFAKGMGEPADVADLRTYTAGDLKVLRLRLVDRGKAVASVDAAQRGQQVMVAIAPGELRYIDRLVSAKAEGPMQAPAAGSLDLGKAFDAAAKMPGSPVAGIPDDQRKQLADLLRGQRISLGASMQGDAATFELTLPPALVRNVPKFAEMFKGSDNEAKVLAAKTDISQLQTALDMFEIDAGRFPTAAEGLGALTKRPAGLGNWKGPYIKRAAPADPWNRQYVYRFPGKHNPTGYDLFSVGPDGREGSGDDVGNWEQK
jgi:general secretion pathway protein G